MPLVAERRPFGGDRPETGSREWAVLMRDELRQALRNARFDQDLARGIFQQLREHGGWQHLHSQRGVPFRSFDHFCSDSNGFGTKRVQLEQRLGVAPLAPHGTNQHSDVGGSNTTSSGGRGADYLIARLKRDAPQIVERLAAGEFRSARAAAIAAGIIKPTTALAVLRRAWRRASPDERETFLHEVTEP